MNRVTKTERIVLNPYGKFLSTCKNNFVVKKGKEELNRVPFWKIGEISVTMGNCLSTNALFWCSIYDIDVVVLSPSGKPLGSFIPIARHDNIKTRIKQYEAFKNEKGLEIAKQFVLGKIEAQNNLLKLYKIQCFESTKLPSLTFIKNLKAKNVDSVRHKLTRFEGVYSKHYFGQILKLFPRSFRVEARNTFHAYEPLNNLFNLAYEILAWKCMRAILRSRLEPYLGFLHSLRDERAGLVCDFQELYRAFIDSFLIEYTKILTRKDFKKEFGRGKTPRMFLKYPESTVFVEALNRFFEKKIPIHRIKSRGRSQRFETLITEETILLSMFIRDKKALWKPRIPNLD